MVALRLEKGFGVTTQTASTKVLDQIRTVLAAARPDVGWFTHRSDQEPITQSELPGVLIRLQRADFTFVEMGAMTEHRALIVFDCFSGMDGVLAIDRVNQDVIASIVSALEASDLLGGRVQSMDPETMDASEENAPDVGMAVLAYSAVWYTAIGDFRTLIGRSGQQF